MSRGAGYAFVLTYAAVLSVAFLAVLYYMGTHADEPQTKWRTHYETVERTVPGPERIVPGPETTVFKKRPSEAVTTWIIVCGENTQRVEGNKPITECNLPDTSGGR